jgi:hypothetical protein
LLAHASGCKICQEVAGLEHMHVFLEILVVMGVKQHSALKTFVMDLLQGYRRPGYILGEALPGAFIKHPYAVVYTESRVTPGEQISGKLLGEQLFVGEEMYYRSSEILGHLLKN